MVDFRRIFSAAGEVIRVNLTSSWFGVTDVRGDVIISLKSSPRASTTWQVSQPHIYTQSRVKLTLLRLFRLLYRDTPRTNSPASHVIMVQVHPKVVEVEH